MSGATSTEYIFNGLFSFFVNRVNFSVVVKDLISLLPSRVPDTPQTWSREETPVSKLQIFGCTLHRVLKTQLPIGRTIRRREEEARVCSQEVTAPRFWAGSQLC